MKKFSVAFGFHHKVVEIDFGTGTRTVDNTMKIRLGLVEPVTNLETSSQVML
jgi:hypothetical protein